MWISSISANVSNVVVSERAGFGWVPQKGDIASAAAKRTVTPTFCGSSAQAGRVCTLARQHFVHICCNHPVTDISEQLLASFVDNICRAALDPVQFSKVIILCEPRNRFASFELMHYFVKIDMQQSGYLPLNVPVRDILRSCEKGRAQFPRNEDGWLFNSRGLGYELLLLDQFNRLDKQM